MKNNNTSTEQLAKKAIKKLKKWQRDALLPLYEKHVSYLLQAISAAMEYTGEEDVEPFFDRILSKWYEDATCHEVAINEYFGVNLKTHENEWGYEKEYTNHPAADGVSRKYRVRYIWARLYSRRDELQDVEPLPESVLNSGGINIHCPYCGQEVYYADGEEVLVNRWCRHMIYRETASTTEWMGGEFQLLNSETYDEVMEYLEENCEVEEEDTLKIIFAEDFEELWEELLEHLFEDEGNWDGILNVHRVYYQQTRDFTGAQYWALRNVVRKIIDADEE